MFMSVYVNIYKYMQVYAILSSYIWNPDHMDKNLQIGTHDSVHGTDMYVHVYEIMYKYKHVCTCYVHVHHDKYTYMYISVHEFCLMYVHGTYMYMRLYLCMYMLQTCT